MALNSRLELLTTLSTLKDKGLISADEYENIASRGHLASAFLKLLVSQYQLQGANVLKIFEVLAAAENPATVTSGNNSSLLNEGENEESINPLQETNKNPLLINTIVRGVFEYLNFDEIKQCRLVCQQWDFTAQPFLRRKGKIHFKPTSLQPATFLEVFKDRLRDLPFKCFKFSIQGSRLPWSVSQLEIFFDKWGKNVKYLELKNVCLIEGQFTKVFDVTPWLEKAKKLTKLKINNNYCYKIHGPPKPTPLIVALDKLKSVKYLHLHGCTISNCPSQNNMITPFKIHLNQVQFEETEQEKQPISLNKYIDFSQATKIILRPQSGISLNMFSVESQKLKADNVYLNNVKILDWDKAKGKVDLLALVGMRYIKRNELQIKIFILDSCKIDMAIVPLSIQQIRFEEGTKIICDHSVVLPELVFLSFRYITQNYFNMISRFASCHNLVEIEIETFTKDCNFFDPLIVTVSLIPRSVKRMKIQGYISFLCDDSSHTLDKLIIQWSNVKPDFLTHVTTMLSNAIQLKVKVLVTAVSQGKLHWGKFEKFVKLNQRFETIVFGVLPRVHTNIPFERSTFFRCVDRKSDYYEFQTDNPIGKAISSSDFDSWSTLTALQTF